MQLLVVADHSDCARDTDGPLVANKFLLTNAVPSTTPVFRPDLTDLCAEAIEPRDGKVPGDQSTP